MANDAIDEILLQCEEKMQKTEDHVMHEFNGVRTGKASPALIENVMVEVYGGSHMRIRELAGITSPEPRQLLVQPWDNGTLGPIEKAIQRANIGLNPMVQGRSLRLIVPELSTNSGRSSSRRCGTWRRPAGWPSATNAARPSII
jgi:ribosome recycling factor